MIDAVVAYGLVLLAELGDKTQLVALTTAVRFGAKKTLAVFACVLVVLQTISVSLGVVLSGLLPERASTVAVGLIFIGFGVWTWASAEGADDVRGPVEQSRRGLLGAAAAFFLAELGDKTMITTAALAAERNVVAVWIGSFAAMLTAAGVAALVGRRLAQKLPTAVIVRAGAVGFVCFGVASLLVAAL